MISVAMTTYNGEKYICEQIESILNQSMKVDEIIVCDDGSSDSTIELLKKYADFDEESIKDAKKVLSAAKLTYISSFLKSLVGWTMLVKKYDFY